MLAIGAAQDHGVTKGRILRWDRQNVKMFKADISRQCCRHGGEVHSPVQVGLSPDLGPTLQEKMVVKVERR